MSDPKSTTARTTFDAKISSPSMRRKSHPWSWIIGIIAALLLAWAFFGRDHLKVDAVTSPAPAASAVSAD